MLVLGLSQHQSIYITNTHTYIHKDKTTKNRETYDHIIDRFSILQSWEKFNSTSASLWPNVCQFNFYYLAFVYVVAGGAFMLWLFGMH